MNASPRASGPETGPMVHRMDPLIRFTLLALYLALCSPLPVLAPPGLRLPLGLALAAGLLLVLAATSERVLVDTDSLQVGHPPWCGWWLRRGWQLRWHQIEAITPVVTSQGGRVFYLKHGERQLLLPQRIERFEAFLARLQRETGLNTASIGRISPPWTYRTLAVLCALMLVGEWAALGWETAISWVTVN